MPLLDHFHAPVYPARRWESFHATWASEIMQHLNRKVLPQGYFAENQVHIGNRIEVDVATVERSAARTTEGNGHSGGVAVEKWAPPVATLAMPAVFPDDIEVHIFQMSGGATLVSAIELVSPANKDRPETRRAFAAKCATYLQRGIGLVVVDVVTDRLANLHDELISMLQQPVAFRFPTGSPLYVAAYHPVRREARGDEIDMWLLSLAVGEPLPTVPLALRGGPILPLDLETTYTAAREGSLL